MPKRRRSATGPRESKSCSSRSPPRGSKPPLRASARLPPRVNSPLQGNHQPARGCDEPRNPFESWGFEREGPNHAGSTNGWRTRLARPYLRRREPAPERRAQIVPQRGRELSCDAGGGKKEKKIRRRQKPKR